MRRIACLVGLLVIVAPLAAYGQPWSGILSPSRAIDWRNVGVAGGIPNRTTVCSTLNPGATASQINAAIQSCPSGQVVRLNAGNFNLTGPINFAGKSNVTLRGAGADQTKVFFVGDVGGVCGFNVGTSVCIDSGECNQGQPAGVSCGGPQHTASWTAGYATGTTVVTLSSTTGLVVGNHLMLDQLDDATDGFPAPGDIYVCGTTACSGEGASDGASMVRSGRHQVQIVTVTAINGNNVTISPGLYMSNWRASQSPGAWWGNRTIKNSGIEDMTLDHAGNGQRPGITFQNALNCWMRGVRSVVPATQTGPNYFNHVRMLISARLTIRDNYIYGTFASANTMYGIVPDHTSDVLVENNIVLHVPTPIQVGADQGSVIAYNFAGDYNGFSQGNNTLIPHNAGGLLALVEGNNATGYTGDIIHGTRHFITQFRNHWVGGSPEGTINWIQAYNRFFNIIGNVLGGSGFSVYEINLSSKKGNEVFSFGDKRSSSYSISSDPFVRITSMRWGNYDTVTGTARFLPAEVPLGIANFANLVPASQTLPPSFYLSARPAWWSTPWGTPPWPAIGPDVTGGNVAGYAGHVYKIPARLCWENSPVDSAYGGGNIRVFNASNCYEGSVGQAVPAPPTSPVVQ